jgi:triacylglycerol lipase
MCPIILLHGIFGFSRLKLGPMTLHYFGGGIGQALAKQGHPVLTPGVHPTASICRRAQQIKEAMLPFLAEHAGQKAILIAHSMGGLDGRYLISQLGMAEHVAALVTIATPHRGSPMADFWVENTPMKRFGLPLCSMLRLDVKGGSDLTLAAAQRFNEEVPDVPGVRYFSISTACPSDRVPLHLRLGHRVIGRREGENDGLVSIQSALWGQHLGTWPVHHLHAINRRFPIDVRCPIKDITPMYLAILDHLEAAGVPL